MPAVGVLVDDGAGAVPGDGEVEGLVVLNALVHGLGVEAGQPLVHPLLGVQLGDPALHAVVGVEVRDARRVLVVALGGIADGVEAAVAVEGGVGGGGVAVAGGGRAFLRQRVFHAGEIQGQRPAGERPGADGLPGHGHGEVLPGDRPLGFVRAFGQKRRHRPVRVELDPLPGGVHGQLVHGDGHAVIPPQIGDVGLGHIPVRRGAGLAGGQPHAEQTGQENHRNFFHGSCVRPLC